MFIYEDRMTYTLTFKYGFKNAVHLVPYVSLSYQVGPDHVSFRTATGKVYPVQMVKL